MRFPLHWLPVALLINTVGSWAVTYMVAASHRHVSGGWPYISDTGTRPPESCIFGQFLNISAFIGTLVVILKFMHVEIVLDRYLKHENTESSSNALIVLLNKSALVLGLLSSLGMSMVANFQVSNVFLVHEIGALLAFVLGAVYGWFITAITIIIFIKRLRQQHRNHPSQQQSEFLWKNIALILVRLLLTITTTTALVLFIVFDKIASSFHHHSSAHWARNRPGWEEHTISTTAEWASSSALFIFISTFAFDFQAHRVKRPRMHRASERGGTSRTGSAAGVHKLNVPYAVGQSSSDDSSDSNNDLSAPALHASEKNGFSFSVV